MNINHRHSLKKILKSIRINLLTILLIVFSCEIIFATENITIETKTDNFFENFISDTILLLDTDLKKIIVDDLAHVVANSKFELVVNNWKPRSSPKIKLVNIYDRFNSDNIKESLAALAQPVVEIACSSQKYDPLNEYQSRCIKDMFKYPIIQPIEIKYIYKSGKTKEQHIANLTGLNDSNRYQQMVRTTADIMNSVYEKVCKKNITKSVNIIKYPLTFVAVKSAGNRSSQSCSLDAEICSAGCYGKWKCQSDCRAAEAQCKKEVMNSKPSANKTTCSTTCSLDAKICSAGCYGDWKCQSDCRAAEARCKKACIM